MTKRDHSTSPERNISPISIPQLRAVFTGRVIGPDDVGYDQARTVFYGGIDRRPAATVRVADESDVSRVVSLALPAQPEHPAGALNQLPTVVLQARTLPRKASMAALNCSGRCSGAK